MTGGKAALWKDEDMADVFTGKATAFIEQHRGKPFFLFFAPHDPHVPRVPHPRFAGATPMGPRGDAIAQLDWSVGEVLATLDRLKLAEDTLVLFTSDNGPVVDDGYRDEAVEKLGDHAPAGPFRGGKYSNFEGGTRVPFVVRWPARVKPAVSDALISQVDLIATFAALVGRPLSDPARARQRERAAGASGLVEDRPRRSGRAGRVAVAQTRKLEVHRARQGAENSAEHEHGARQRSRAAALRSGGGRGERNNLAATRPEKVRELAAMLEGIRRATAQQLRRPNIVLAIADDWSFPHAGIYGDRTVSTPNVDRVAREGVRFTHAFVAAPSCTPSRAALLTGQAVHRLEEGGNLHGFLPKSYPVYPDLLEEAGYVVGHTGKGWGPGRFEAGGRARNPAGPLFKSFDEFMERRAKGSPFCFWFGSTDPHRPYEPGTGAQSGMKPERVQVPRLPARHRGGPERSARLLLRSPAVRPRSRAHHRGARARGRAREHDRHRDVGQRHALPARQGQRLRWGRARAARHPMAGRVPRRHRHRVVRQPHRSGAHDSGRRGDQAARRDDRTQPAASLARRIADDAIASSSNGSAMRTCGKAI